jgi:hypothetical protein
VGAARATRSAIGPGVKDEKRPKLKAIKTMRETDLRRNWIIFGYPPIDDENDEYIPIIEMLIIRYFR